MSDEQWWIDMLDAASTIEGAFKLVEFFTSNRHDFGLRTLIGDWHAAFMPHDFNIESAKGFGSGATPQGAILVAAIESARKAGGPNKIKGYPQLSRGMHEG